MAEINVPFVLNVDYQRIDFSNGMYMLFNAIMVSDNGKDVVEIVIERTDNPHLQKMQQDARAWHINPDGQDIQAGEDTLHFYYAPKIT